jgi:iron complex transport system substrate-binding protein
MDHLVAVSHECDYPEEANHKPRVTGCSIHGKGLDSAAIDRWVTETLRSSGTLYTIDEKLLQQLAPELMLTQRLCDVCAPAYGSVEAMAKALPAKPRVLNLEPKGLDDIFSCIRAVAAAMGHGQRGLEVCLGLERRVLNVQTAVTDLRQPTVFVMEWADPIFNAGHWNPELVRLARGTPVLSREGEDSVRIAWADLRAADPEVLIIACCGHGVERTKRDLPILERLPHWYELQAVRNRRTYLADGAAYFSRPGPRIVDTLEMVASMLHPELGRGLCRRAGFLQAY